MSNGLVITFRGSSRPRNRDGLCGTPRGVRVTFCQPYDNILRLLGEQYRHAVELVGSSGERVAYVVMERLAEIAPRMTLNAVERAALIVAGDTHGWVARLHQEELRSILRAGLSGDERGAREAAIDLVNRLVARGETDFRGLLHGS